MARPADLLAFDRGDSRFQVRVAGVLRDHDRILLQGAEGEPTLALPGGRAEMGEVAGEALRRELREELREHATVGRLLWVVENFFRWHGRPYHEICFVFEAALPEGSPALAARSRFDGFEDGARIFFEWHDQTSLASAPLFPTFLRSALLSPPSSPQHVVHRDEGA